MLHKFDKQNYQYIRKVKYTGYIYNVLMLNHYVINANNLLCEILDPNHMVAKKYVNRETNKYNPFYKSVSKISI